MNGRRLAVCVLLLTAAACDDHPCSERFDLDAWCDETQQCFVSGNVADCAGRCTLPSGDTLGIALTDLHRELRERRELEITLLHRPSRQFDPTRISATLDGVEGEHIPSVNPNVPKSFTTAVRWPRFPENATLELTAPGSELMVDLEFYDHDCEQANPTELELLKADTEFGRTSDDIEDDAATAVSVDSYGGGAADNHSLLPPPPTAMMPARRGEKSRVARSNSAMRRL